MVETDSYKDVREIDILEDKKGEDPTRRIQKHDLMRLVTKGLNRNERLIIILYYYEELTMKEIGATLDLSESRVSQMHSRLSSVCNRNQSPLPEFDLMPGLMPRSIRTLPGNSPPRRLAARRSGIHRGRGWCDQILGSRQRITTSPRRPAGRSARFSADERRRAMLRRHLVLGPSGRANRRRHVSPRCCL
jgi:hypothetical protein